MYSHILLATDGYPLSTKAAKAAVALARALGARITAFHAIPPFMAPPFMDGVVVAPELYSPEDYRRSTERHAKKLLDKVAAHAKSAGVKCDTLFTTGNLPWEEIVKAAKAKRCDLIVMASHGRRGVAGVLLGSETTKVLTHSKVPVLVCR